jgi:hypothetical protein
MPKQRKPLRPCLCLCGHLTGGLYHPGCDQTVRIALARDIASDNPDAARVLATLADKSVPPETKRQVYAEYHATYQLGV